LGFLEELVNTCPRSLSPIVIIPPFRGFSLRSARPNPISGPEATNSNPASLGTIAKRLARAAIPASLLLHISAYRALEAPARRAYVRLLLARTIGRRKPTLSPNAPLPSAVMFVCYGNIIRSAFSEVLLRAELDRLGMNDIEVISSGTGARSGREADRRAIELAPEFGVSLERHRATRVNRELMDRCNVIFAMDFSNQAELAAQFPDALSKILFLTPAPEEAGSLQVPDPYTGDMEDVRACYKVLKERIRLLAAQFAQCQARSRTYSGNGSS
jgi:protein-tyrosine phosphatase